ncbi:MAG: hypothetical protein ACXWQZ_23750, partial [Ktedonobacterales bacterium]
MNLDFSSLAVDTKLANQFAGVTFLQYQHHVGGVVVDTPSGHVASFNDAPGVEFFSSGANIAFSNLQRKLTLHVGLLPVPGADVRLYVRLTAFDAEGLAWATAIASVTAGAGFGTPLTVTLATPRIASVLLEAVDDTWLQARIALHDMIFDDAPSGSGPDFVLEGPPAITVLQGGPPVDVPLDIRRIDGSSGDISFALSDLPAGVSATFLPNPADMNSATLRVQAAIGPAPEIRTALVIATPLTASAGPALRTLAIDLATHPMLRVSGPADIDFAGCAPNGVYGTVTREYMVIRDPLVTGPISASLEGLPADVTGTVSPSTLQFPNGAIGQQVSVSLTTIAGPTIPDTWITLRLTGPDVDMPFRILVHGSFSQQNRNFVIRGQFSYIDPADSGAPMPLIGAQVEIFRYRSDWYDDRVDVTYT